MKKILLIQLFTCLFFGVTQAQTYIYDGSGNVIGGTHIKFKPGTEVKLIDSLTNNYYVLESNNVFIAAYNKSGKMLWRTDPYTESDIKEYKTSRPFVVNFEFITSHSCYSDGKDKKAIWINYNNTQAGYIDLKSGKFHFCGQD